MKILSLRIMNFLTIGDSGVLKLADRGLVLLQGVNEDDASTTSNGAGKSTIPDALCWALYGTTARCEGGDDVVHNKVKKNCMVEVVMQDGDSIYVVRRHRKHATGKNGLQLLLWNPADTHPGGTAVDMSKGIERETQAVIDGVMGCDYEVFKAAIYAGQENMPDLPGMTDKELKMLVERAAGTDRLERAYRIALTAEGAVASDLEKVRTAHSGHEARLVSLKAQHLNQKRQHGEFEAGRAGRQKVKQDEAHDYAIQMKAKADSYRGMPLGFLKPELEALNEQMATHSARVRDRDALQRDAHDAERQVTLAEQNCARTGDNIRQTRAKVISAQGGNPCGECGKPMTANEIDTVLVGLNREIEALKVTAETDIRLFAQKRAALGKAQEAVQFKTDQIPDVSVISARISEINMLLRDGAQLANDIVLLRKNYDSCQASADASLAETNPYQSALDLMVSQIADEDVQVMHTLGQVHSREGKLAFSQSVTKVFSPGGVRAHILDTVTPFLNDRTAEYLSALSDGNITAIWSTLTTTAKGELREKFNIEVNNAMGGHKFGLISGGEKRKPRLATVLALQDLVATRATKPIDLWIGDEIDEALDPAGLERLMGVLESKARERGTVLIISHNSLQDWCDNVVTVTKKGGVSTVEGVLCD